MRYEVFLAARSERPRQTQIKVGRRLRVHTMFHNVWQNFGCENSENLYKNKANIFKYSCLDIYYFPVTNPEISIKS